VKNKCWGFEGHKGSSLLGGVRSRGRTIGTSRAAPPPHQKGLGVRRNLRRNHGRLGKDEGWWEGGGDTPATPNWMRTWKMGAQFWGLSLQSKKG